MDEAKIAHLQPCLDEYKMSPPKVKLVDMNLCMNTEQCVDTERKKEHECV